MGVDARLVVYAPDLPAAERACEAAFSRIAALDTIMSDYRRGSELNRLCARAGGAPVPVSPELYRVLERAGEISRQSGGAFDPTAGPLIALWRAARKNGRLPDQKELDRARRLVGWGKVRLDPSARTVRLALPGMKLDLGGIAKGHAADEAQRVLRAHGVDRALVQLGGDLVVSGAPPGTDGWRVRVPNADEGAGPRDLAFVHRAVSTSGDTEQFAVIGGRRYSHVVDPRTGRALTNRVQVTVTAADGLTADPVSTAVSVLGEEEGHRLLRRYPGCEAFIRVLPLNPAGAQPCSRGSARWNWVVSPSSPLLSGTWPPYTCGSSGPPSASLTPPPACAVSRRTRPASRGWSTSAVDAPVRWWCRR